MKKLLIIGALSFFSSFLAIGNQAESNPQFKNFIERAVNTDERIAGLKEYYSSHCIDVDRVWYDENNKTIGQWLDEKSGVNSDKVFVAVYAFVAPYRTNKDASLRQLCQWYCDNSLDIEGIKSFIEHSSYSKGEYPSTVAFLTELRSCASGDDEQRRLLLACFDESNYVDSRKAVSLFVMSIVGYYVWHYLSHYLSKENPQITHNKVV